MILSPRYAWLFSLVKPDRVVYLIRVLLLFYRPDGQLGHYVMDVLHGLLLIHAVVKLIHGLWRTYKLSDQSDRS